jgi:hypothetical protein
MLIIFKINPLQGTRYFKPQQKRPNIEIVSNNRGLRSRNNLSIDKLIKNKDTHKTGILFYFKKN